jgi:hypothetical protein
LTTFEEIYRDHFPDLRLRRWTKPIFTWLTHPVLDPDATGRVTMDSLTRFVTGALRRAHDQQARDVNEPMLEATAELMILRRDEIVAIDEVLAEGLPQEEEK